MRSNGEIVAFALFAVGCAEPLPELIELSVVSGDGQVAQCYTELPAPVVVQLTREGSTQPVADHAVNFRVLEGDGWMSAGTAFSDARGLATDHWTVGDAGPQVMEARVLSGDGTRYVYGRFTATAQFPPGAEHRITTDGAGHFSPAIYGDRIVWEDSRNGNMDIYLYDLATNTERQITSDAWPYGLAIYGDRIVWEDSRNGNWDIYLYQLATCTPP